MGVQNLWTLLEPCGRRVNIEALTNKRLAVDASIWIFQFMQTMRDSRGEMLKNAHILGFFRRICRLLFHRIRPIFIFDGATPPLKRRTTIARRRRREQQTAKLRKTAEKLLMAQLKKRALQMNTAQNDGDEEVSAADALSGEERAAASKQALETIQEEEEDEIQDVSDTSKDAMLAQQLAAELEGGAYAQEMLGHLQAGNAAGVEELTRRAASAVAASPAAQAPENKQANVKKEEDEVDEDEEDDGDEEVMVPEGIDVDPVVMSTLPPSMQLDLMQKIRDNKIYENRAHFQKHAAQPLNFSSFQIQEYLKASAYRRQIDGLKDAMNASVVAGVEGAVARRIAADEGREYILQREEPDKPQSPKASTPVAEQKPYSNGNALEISFELPSDRKIDMKSILLGSPQRQKQTSSEEEEWLDVETGQPASVSKAKKRAQSEDAEQEQGSGLKKPRDWKERKAQRQKYWSVSQGFRFGRKLAEWGEDAPARPGLAHAAGHDGEEDADVQEAIRRSLMDGQGKQAGSEAEDSDNEGDLVWQGFTPPDEAGPSSSLAAANGNSAAHAISLAAGKNSSSPQTPAKSSGVEIFMSKAAGMTAQAVADSSRTCQDKRQDEAAEQRSWDIEEPRTEAPGSSQRPRKKIKLPSLSEQSKWQPLSTASPHHIDGAIAGQASSAKLAQMSIVGSASGRPAAAEHSAQGRSYQEKGVQPANVKEEPQDPVAAALKEALDAAENEAIGESDVQKLQELDYAKRKADDESDIQKVFEQGRAGPIGLHGKQPAGTQPLAASHADALRVSRSAPGRDLGDVGRSAAAECQQQADTKPQVQSSAASTPPEEACSKPPAQQSDGDSGRITAQKHAQQQNGPGSIAFTGLVQDVSQSMPGIPAGPAAKKQTSPPEQQAQGSTKVGRSDSELAAEAEEEMRADMARQEQQEPPDEDGASADPWAEDPWGQGSLWEDPGQGQPWVGSPPTASAQAGSIAAPRPGQPAYQPVAAAFNMDEELLQLEQQTKNLKASHRKQVGTTESPTTDMYGDCQELLQLFGLPYIIAPAEAEAQCAWLDAQGLVDGVVTDDNDAFLFGAKHIYRHIFEGRKYVEEYHTTDIERELGMDRLGLICLALLLGSDYTEGVAGIGIVNAVEVVRAFKEENGMQRFRDWVMNPDEEELREAAQPKPKRGRKRDVGSDAGDAARAEEDVAEEEKALREFKRNHRKMRRNWDLPSKFPDLRVVDAYRKPALDESKERFTYGRPDAQLIRNFCLEKFGWNFEKVNQILDPVLKAYDARQAQATMDSFLAFNERFAKIRSKRLQQAVKGISKTHNPDMMEDYGADTPKKPACKRSKKSNAAADAATPGSSEPASQLGVFADRSDSDEEALAQLTPEAPGSEKHGKGQRSAGGRAGKGEGRGRGKGRGKSHGNTKQATTSQDMNAAQETMNSEVRMSTKFVDEDVDWEDV